MTIRELRNKGGEIIDRVIGGEVLMETRDGLPLAKLVPLPRRPLTAAELVARRRNLPPMDLDELRRELDKIIEPSL